jgi:signal transduction histidine kinase
MKRDSMQLIRGWSVRTKVFLLFSGATLLTVAPVLYLVGQAVEERVYERATGELQNASEQLRLYWSAQDAALRADARRIAQQQEVAALLIRNDTTGLRRLLKREAEGNSVVLAADERGAARVGPPLDSATLAGGGPVGSGSIVTLPPGSEIPVRVAIAPVSGPDTAAMLADTVRPTAELRPLGPDSVPIRVLGVVGVGTLLDSTAIQELRNFTGGPVALIVGDSVVATTLPDSLAGALSEINFSMVLRRPGTFRSPVERLPYLFAVNALPTADKPAAVLVFRSVAQELRIARGIKQSVVGIGLVALVLAVALALLVARIVARPAQALAAAATDLARGNFGAPLPPASGDEIGQLTRAFGEMRSAIAAREARLRSAQAELIHREKLAAMGRLVAQLSHEINNPIYNIQNCLEVLDRRGDPKDPNREFLELAREELDRMAGLTRQLLDQSRPLSDAARPMDVNQMVQRVMTLAAPELEARGVRSEVRLEPLLPRVVVHPDAIQQVLANLVDNAADAMPDGGVLRVTTQTDAEAVEVLVEDTGSGISEENLPHIFEAFYTTKPGVRGIGLGLFVSEGIIRGHRGRLLVESKRGKGSRFTVQLPRETMDAALAEAGPAEPEDAPAQL